MHVLDIIMNLITSYLDKLNEQAMPYFNTMLIQTLKNTEQHISYNDTVQFVYLYISDMEITQNRI